jgi:hypothetical protein
LLTVGGTYLRSITGEVSGKKKPAGQKSINS